MAAVTLSKEKQNIFENMSIPRAVATMAIPTILSQIVTMIYNLADTFFIGQMQDPYMVAAISVVGPWFHMLTAFGNLFGVGGNSLISRMLGAGRHEECKWISAFSIYGSVATGAAFSLLTLVFMTPILGFLGASENTIVFYYIFAILSMVNLQYFLQKKNYCSFFSKFRIIFSYWSCFDLLQ